MTIHLNRKAMGDIEVLVVILVVVVVGNFVVRLIMFDASIEVTIGEAIITLAILALVLAMYVKMKRSTAIS